MTIRASDDVETWATRRPWQADGALVALALSARLVSWVAAASRLDIPVADLALLFDGHVYLLIARTAPWLYVGGKSFFSLLPNDERLAGWFPVYPLLIAPAELVTGDLRWAALLVATVGGVVATVLVRRLAARLGSPPFATAALFALLPPGWLLASSLALAESALVPLATAAAVAVLRRNDRLAFLAAGVAAIAQKAGILVILLIAAMALGRRDGPLSLARALRLTLLATVPLALLHLWHGMVFGDPLVGAKVLQPILGERLLSVPFVAIARGFLHPDEPFVAHRLPTLATLAFYAGAMVLALRHGRQGRWAALWIGVVILFFASLYGPWPYLSLWRFATLAAPFAICAWTSVASRSLRRPLVFASTLVLALTFTVAAVRSEVGRASAIMEAVYRPEYFELFIEEVVNERPSAPAEGSL